MTFVWPPYQKSLSLLCDSLKRLGHVSSKLEERLLLLINLPCERLQVPIPCCWEVSKPLGKPTSTLAWVSLSWLPSHRLFYIRPFCRPSQKQEAIHYLQGSQIRARSWSPKVEGFQSVEFLNQKLLHIWSSSTFVLLHGALWLMSFYVLAYANYFTYIVSLPCLRPEDKFKSWRVRGT